MYSLVYLNCKEVLRDIASEDPTLIYYIWHKIDPIKYQNQPFIDIEQDCEKLDDHGITEFKRRKERPTHGVTEESCIFSRNGKNIAIELCQRGVGDELLKFIRQIQQKRNNTYVDKGIFSQEFVNYFTFDEDSSKLIENRIQDLKDKYNIYFPDNNHEIRKNGNVIYIRYSIEENTFYISFILECTCSEGRKTEVKKIPNKIDFNFKHNVSCGFCENVYIISHDLWYCGGIITKNSL